jgi:hypothetical protein
LQAVVGGFGLGGLGGLTGVIGTFLGGNLTVLDAHGFVILTLPLSLMSLSFPPNKHPPSIQVFANNFVKTWVTVLARVVL